MPNAHDSREQTAPGGELPAVDREELGVPPNAEAPEPLGQIVPNNELPAMVRQIRGRTPARLLAGRAGAAYRTGTQLELRAAHASARDAVRIELDLNEHLGADFIREFGIFEVCTEASSKDQYLLRPDLGRRFDPSSRSSIASRCTDSDLQIVLGDGLSVTALATQGPVLLRLLCAGAKERGWRLGQSFVIRHCRVGILNDIGELLHPKVVVLLIGERPGLATAESLSAYMAYRPDKSHTDANRNLISNIHTRGLTTEKAANRILTFTARMMESATSGCQLTEEVSPFLKTQPLDS